MSEKAVVQEEKVEEEISKKEIYKEKIESSKKGFLLNLSVSELVELAEKKGIKSINDKMKKKVIVSILKNNPLIEKSDLE